VRTLPNSPSVGALSLLAPSPRLVGQNRSNPTAARPSNARKTAGQPSQSATTGPPACPRANPTGALAVKTPTAVARWASPVARLTMSIPAFQTTT
jgi:hypothetical protein